MAVKLTKSSQGQATIVTKDTKTGVENMTQETVGAAAPLDAPVCTVGVELGMTRNLGDYNSARFSVRLDMPCAPAEIDAAYVFAVGWVNARIEQIIEESTAD